jgi:pentatricopeptide repeat protein
LKKQILIVCLLLVNAYGLNGMGIQAVEIFRQMSSKFINEVTYVCALNACSHSGLVDEARSIFANIQIKTEKIYTTMVY